VRQAESYRGYRRNWAFGRNHEGGRYPFIRLAGDNWKRPFDESLVKRRPVVNTSWNWAWPVSTRKQIKTHRNAMLNARTAIENMIKKFLPRHLQAVR
jgi:hypothetical protein